MNFNFISSVVIEVNDSLLKALKIIQIILNSIQIQCHQFYLN